MNRTTTATVAIRARDGTGGVFSQVAAKMRGIEVASKRANTAAAVAAHRQAQQVGLAARAADSARAGMLAMPGRFLGPAAAAYGLKQATDSALSFERTMFDVEKATDSSAAQARVYEEALLAMARATGKTKEELGSMLAAAGFAGRPVQDLLRFVEYGARATSAWGLNAEDTGQALAELGSIYQANQTRIEEIGDAIDAAADMSASREGDLLEFIRRAGASGRQAGISAEHVLAFGAALKEVGVRTDVAATGFEALLNLMKLGDEFSASAKDGFKALGVNSEAMRKAFVAKPLETTLKLLEKINKVKDPLKKAEIMTDLFGKEYQDDIAKLLNGLPRLTELLGKMGDRANYVGRVMNNALKIDEKDFQKIARAQQAIDVLGTRLGAFFKLKAGGIAEEISKVIDAVEKGDHWLNKVEAAAGRYVARTIADQENRADGGKGQELGTYDPETRAAVNRERRRLAAEAQAHRDKETRDRIDVVRQGLDVRIAREEATANTYRGRPGEMSQRRSAEATARADTIRAELAELDRLIAAYDELQVRMAEVQGPINRVERTQAFDVSRREGAYTPAGPGRLGFDVNGPRSGASTVGLPPGVAPRVVPSPLPPDQRLGSTELTPRVNTEALDAAKGKATDAGKAIRDLDMMVSPRVNTASMDSAITKGERLKAILHEIGNLANTGASRSVSFNSYTDT
ncbi:MAG TPA: phage tail tape measure protein [Microvirga sp.]|jgi:TP901 family phage tail tape measure protein|nr:phage tail tape measure protein [Microvirga sp.]